MSLFLITFITLYASLHAYAFVRMRGAFSPGRTTTTLLAAWLILMTAAPILVHLAESTGLERSALIVAWSGYTWMGTIFIFASVLLAIDALRLAVWLSNRLWGTGIPGFLTATITCEVALIVAAFAGAYAFYDARQIRTDHVTLTTAKLPLSSGKVRIVQISDVHIGLLFRETRLKEVLDTVRSAAPDILVSTGDLVDGRLSREEVITRLDRLAWMMASIRAPGGKYAVTGNHEYYAGLKQSLGFTQKAGFTVLRNQSVTLANGITISGVDDPAGLSMGLPAPSPPEQALLKSAPVDRFHLLLKHRPVVAAASDGFFDLQLSGHVHKGQLFPFNLLVRLRYPIPCGTTTTTKGNSLIHVSRGSGTWGPPMRLLAPPEVTIIDIVPKK